MVVQDNTINIKFDEVKTGQCFVLYSSYYMKIRVSEYDNYTNSNVYKYVGLDLSSGLCTEIKFDEKVRVVKGTLVIN